LKNSEYVNVFIFRVGSLGDSIVTLPAIKRINEHYKVKLHLITNKPSKGIFSSWEIFKLTDYFKNCFEFDYTIKSILNLRKYIQQEKKQKIIFYFADISNFRRNFRNYLFFKALGFSKVYGWRDCIGDYIRRDSNGQLLEVVPEYERLENIVDNYLDTRPKFNKYFNFIKFDKRFISNSHQKFNFLDKAYFVIGVGGKAAIQHWNIDNYVQVLKNINKEVLVVILGGKDDYKDAAKIQSSLPNLNINNLCNQTSIHESAFILSKAILYLGNDTGTAHLAGIVNTKCMVITSGRNNLGAWTPYGLHHLIIRKRTNCEGCFLSSLSDCKFNLNCMSEIDVYEVKNKLFKQLEKL
jgi:heptosyltransferase III